MATATMASEIAPQLRIDFPMADLEDICRRWKVRRLAIFGSAVRDDFTTDSDVDVLYEVAREDAFGWAIVDFVEELSRLFGGRKVDAGGFRYINWRIRDRVLNEAVTLYERE
jgi:predicted nucleotidyltransferase